MAAAIADPVRRSILLMLRGQRLTVGAIVERFDISRPAVSRHLRVLRDAGLVHDTLDGRHRFYELDPAPLVGLGDWLDQFALTSDWERRLDALETEVRRTGRERRRRATTEQRQENTA